MTRQYEYVPAYSEGPVVSQVPSAQGRVAAGRITGRDAGEDDCIQRYGQDGRVAHSADKHYVRQYYEPTKEMGYLEKWLLRFGTKLRGGGGRVTPEEISGRYVSLEKYVPGKHRHR